MGEVGRMTREMAMESRLTPMAENTKESSGMTRGMEEENSSLHMATSTRASLKMASSMVMALGNLPTEVDTWDTLKMMSSREKERTPRVMGIHRKESGQKEDSLAETDDNLTLLFG